MTFIVAFLKFRSLLFSSDSFIDYVNQLEAADDILVKLNDFVKASLGLALVLQKWVEPESPKKWDDVFLFSIFEDLKIFKVAFFSFLPGLHDPDSRGLFRVISDFEYFNLPALYLRAGHLSSARVLLKSIKDFDSRVFRSWFWLKLLLF